MNDFDFLSNSFCVLLLTYISFPQLQIRRRCLAVALALMKAYDRYMWAVLPRSIRLRQFPKGKSPQRNIYTRISPRSGPFYKSPLYTHLQSFVNRTRAEQFCVVKRLWCKEKLSAISRRNTSSNFTFYLNLHDPNKHFKNVVLNKSKAILPLYLQSKVSTFATQKQL